MNEESHTYLVDEAAFKAYKGSLDEDGDYGHRHSGNPTHFPCLVTSIFWDDPNGHYSYFHEFTYREDLEGLLMMFYNPQELEAHEHAVREM